MTQHVRITGRRAVLGQLVGCQQPVQPPVDTDYRLQQLAALALCNSTRLSPVSVTHAGHTQMRNLSSSC